MAEVATLLLGADSTGLLKGEAAIDSVVATAVKAEARVTAAMDGVSDAMTGAGAAAQASAKTIADAEAMKSRIADLTAAAVRTALATESLARDSAARAAQSAADRVTQAALAKSRAEQAASDAVVRAERQAAAARDSAMSGYQSLRASIDPAYAAELRMADAAGRVSAALKAQVISEAEAARMTGLLAAETQAVGKSGFAAGGGVRMLGQQLSQVAQQGAVTGNYLGALAVQLPDMALGFGSVAIAASIVATIALPMVISAFGGGKSAAEKAKDANDAYTDSFDAMKSNMSAAIDLQGSWQTAVQSGSAAQMKAVADEANIRSKLLQIDMMDLQTKGNAAAQALTAAQQQLNAVKDIAAARQIEVSTAQANLASEKSILDILDAQLAAATKRNDVVAIDSINTMITTATGNYQQFEHELAAADAALKSQNVTLTAQQNLHDKASLEYQLIGAQIASNSSKLLTTESLLKFIAAAAGNIPGSLSSAAGAASALSSQLATALNYAIGIRSAIANMSFSNIGLAAENAAMLAGKSQYAASALGAIAEQSARLQPMLRSQDGIMRAAAQQMLAESTAQITQNATLQEQHAALIKAQSNSASGAKAAAAAAAKTQKTYDDLIGSINPLIDAQNELATSTKEIAKAQAAGYITAVQAAKAQLLVSSRYHQAALEAQNGIDVWSTLQVSGADNLDKLINGTESWGDAIGDVVKQMEMAIIKSALLANVNGGLGTMSIGGLLVQGATAGFAPQTPAGGTAPNVGLLAGLGNSFGALGGLFGMGGATAGAGAAAGVAGAAGAASGLMAAMPAIGAVIAGVSLVAGLFKRHDTGGGITGTYAGGNFSGQEYSTSKNFFGSRTETDSLSSAADSAIDKTLAGLHDSVLDMAGTLGIGAEALDGFTASIKFSTFGLSKDEAAAKLQATLTGVGDSMADLAMGAANYAHDGEAQLAALTRLATALPAVNGVLGMLGDEVYSIGLVGADAASQLADAFGGLEAMTTASKSYFDLFFSDAEKLAANTKAVQDAFGKLGVAMPLTREAYRALVSAQDLSTAAGRTLYAALISMAGAMDQVLPAATALTQAIAGLVSSAGGQLDNLISGTQAALPAAEQAASQWYDAATNLRGYIADLRGAKSDLVSSEATRAYNEARFQMLMAQAMAGSQAAYKSLTGAAGDLLSSTTDSAHTAVEAAIQQARIIADLSKAANVADLQGGKNDVVAGLLRQQKGILTSIKDYLAAGGVLDPAHIDALNGQLGALQSAIADAQSIDYAQVVASLDVTATLISKTTDPALKALLENAQHEIEGTVNFDATVDGLTPAQRWLALHAVSEHIRTVNLVANSTGMSAGDAALALAISSTAEKTITATFTSTMSDQDKMLALAVTGTIIRTVNVALGEVNDQARSLALAVTGDIARNVSATITEADASSTATRLALAASSAVTQTVNAALGARNHRAEMLALAESADLARMVHAYIKPSDRGSNAVLLGLATATVLARTITATLTTPPTDDAVILGLKTEGDLISHVIAKIGKRSEADALTLGLATSAALMQHINAMQGGDIDQDAWDLGLATDSRLVRRILGKWDTNGIQAAIDFAELGSSKLVRHISANWSPDVVGAARDLALSGGGLLQRSVTAVWGSTIDPDMLALALGSSSDLTRTLIGEVDLTGLTDDQLAFLNSLTGSTAGTITLGGTFQWDPSTGFQTWLEHTTQANIADPLDGLKTPLDNLRNDLTALSNAIKAQTVADEAARAAEAAAAAAAKKLADWQAKGAFLASARAGAVNDLKGKADAITALDGSLSGVTMKDAHGNTTHPTVNADGTLNYNADHVDYTSDSQLAAWRAAFRGPNGLEQQLFAANAERRRIDRLIAHARQQVIDMGGVPTFARGGMHPGGLRIVGERGPELEATGPARIYTARQTQQMMQPDSSEMIRELKALREEVKRLREQSLMLEGQIASNTKKALRIEESWEAAGMPPERAVL